MPYEVQGNKLVVQIRQNGKSGPICNLKVSVSNDQEEEKFPFTRLFGEHSTQ